MHPNPYADDLGSRDPLDALADTPTRMRELVERWGEDRFERSYTPGKWSARLILVHLAQTELALTNRARMAIAIPDRADPVCGTLSLNSTGEHAPHDPACWP